MITHGATEEGFERTTGHQDGGVDGVRRARSVSVPGAEIEGRLWFRGGGGTTEGIEAGEEDEEVFHEGIISGLESVSAKPPR